VVRFCIKLIVIFILEKLAVARRAFYVNKCILNWYNIDKQLLRRVSDALVILKRHSNILITTSYKHKNLFNFLKKSKNKFMFHGFSK
jgi:hypothetical protein